MWDCGSPKRSADPDKDPFQVKVALKKQRRSEKKRGTVPVCEERSLAFVFGLDEEAELLTTSTTGL